MDHAAVYSSDAPIPETPEMSEPRTARSTDASRLTFPVQMVIAMIVMTVSIIGAVYGMTNGIRDSQFKTELTMRELQTRMDMQQRVNDAETKAQGVIFENMKSTVEQLRAQVQLLQLQYAELNKQISAKGTR